MGIHLVGFFDDRSIGRLEATSLSQVDVRGGFESLIQKARILR